MIKTNLLKAMLAILKFSKNYCFSILFLAFCLFITNKQVNGLRFWPVLNAISLFLIINIVGKVKNRILRYVLRIFFVSLLTFDAVYGVLYKNFIDFNVVASIFETNIMESTSMVGDVLWQSILLFIISFALFYLSGREMKKHCKLNIKKSLVIYILFVVLSTSFLYLKLAHKHALDEEGKDDFFEFSYIEKRFEYNFMFGILSFTNNQLSLVNADIFGILAYQTKFMTYNKYHDADRTIPEELSFNKDKEAPFQKIFLIVGESASMPYHSLYGYEVPTTPFLDSMKVNSDQLDYVPGISSHVLTRVAVPYMMTPQNARTGESEFRERRNLLELARMAGYETYWISNQDMEGVYEGDISMISLTADERFHFIKGHGKTFERVDDLALIDEVGKRIKKDKKQFFVIHLEGSHRSFSDRHDEIDTEAIPDTDDHEVDEYNRTIHHTDRLVRGIYQLFAEGENNLLYCTSDHGERPGTIEGRLAKGHLPPYYIPLLTINDMNYDMDSLLNSYYSETIKRVNNINTYYILSEVMGYDFSAAGKKKAIEDSEYVMVIGQFAPLFVKDIEE